VDRVCNTRAIPGNAITQLIDGPEAFAAMLALIDQAQQWVHFENYIIRDDAIGTRFAERLIAAAHRGISVSVLVDHWGSRRTSRGYWKRLRSHGIHVRTFNRLNVLRPFASVRRNHRKYMGVDGMDAILGGICIGDEWAGEPERGQPPWRDAAVHIVGPAVPKLEWSFLRLWQASDGPAPDYRVPAKVDPRGEAAVRVVEGVPGSLRLYRAIGLLAASAAGRIWVTDAYLVVATPLFASLGAAARDGVDVRILVPGHTDIPAVRTLTRVGYRELLEAGVRIWEWHGPMLHAKTIVVDDTFLKVGSSNLNPSSFLANHELDVLISGPTASGSAAQQFRRDLTNAVEIVLRPVRAPEALSTRLPPAVVPSEPLPVPPGQRAPGELSRRTVVALRTVVGGARRSLAGAVVFTLLGSGVLFVALPRVMAYGLAVFCFGLAGAATWQFLERRRHSEG
jgi:cardiolipin synthase